MIRILAASMNPAFLERYITRNSQIAEAIQTGSPAPAAAMLRQYLVERRAQLALALSA